MSACELGRVHAQHRNQGLDGEVRLRDRHAPAAQLVVQGGAMPRVAAETAELLGPAVPHPTPCEQLLLELLLQGRDVEQLEREGLSLTGHQVVVLVQPGGERGAVRVEVEQRSPGHNRQSPQYLTKSST